jgi:periplasmic protein CpxP/Spy
MVNTMALSPLQQKGFRPVRVVLLSMLVAVSATVALSAWARPGGGGHGEGRHGEMMMGGSPEHMARRMDHMLDGLNATDAQRAQIKQIAAAAAADMKTQHAAHQTLREKSQSIFAAPTVDAAAAESVRQQMLAQHDATSRRMLETRLAIANVLTPEQRAKLAERQKERGARMKDRMQRMDRDGSKK